MESFEIPDSAISASSNWDTKHAARYARLRMTAGDGHVGGWSALHNNLNQWLQIDLGGTTEILKIATQGRQDTEQWVTSFKMAYSTDGNLFESYANNKVFLTSIL